MSAVASGHKYTKIVLTFQNIDVIYSYMLSLLGNYLIYTECY